MKTFLKLSAFLLLFMVSYRISFSQDMVKPEPVKSALLDKLMGVWTADPYEMMGSSCNEEANHTMELNGQFMFISIKGNSTKGESWSGIIVVKPGKDGTIKGWAFDDWGNVTTYEGTVKDDNHFTITGTSDWGTETRDITIDGENMTHNCSWTMKGQDGKEQSMKLVITYHKKK